MKSIRNRNIKIQLWLNKAEARNLQEKARRSHLSVAAYLRQLISGVVPKEAPPPDFFSMMRELHYIGNNLNQIARYFHGGGLASRGMLEELKKCIAEIRELRQEIVQLGGVYRGNSKAHRK